MFGFRPDLTRRSEDCRWYLDESSGHQRPCSARESIAIEIVMNRTCLSRFTILTEMGLHSLTFLSYANGINGAVEYLLAAASCGRKAQTLIFESLEYLHGHIANWGNNSDGLPLILMVRQSLHYSQRVPIIHLTLCISFITFYQVFTMLTAIPDEKQHERISMIMLHDDGTDRHEGLLRRGGRLTREYPNDARARVHINRYSEVLRVLRKQHAVSNWMSRNRAYCEWIEPEAHPEYTHPLQSRSDHHDRRGGGYHNAPEHVPNHNPNADDDSGIDDDSRSDDDDNLVENVVVQGCGVPEANGEYSCDGSHDKVAKYCKRSMYRGRVEMFSLYRCRLTDNTR